MSPTERAHMIVARLKDGAALDDGWGLAVCAGCEAELILSPKAIALRKDLPPDQPIRIVCGHCAIAVSRTIAPMEKFAFTQEGATQNAADPRGIVQFAAEARERKRRQG